MKKTPRTVPELTDWLFDNICAGVWPPDTRLPSERRLAADLGLHRRTVSAAYQRLSVRGLVVPRGRSGTWVADDLWGVQPDTSRRLGAASFRPGATLMARVRAARSAGELIDFSHGGFGGPPLLPEPYAQGVIPSSDPSIWDYAPSAGWAPLQHAVSRRLEADHGMQIDPGSVLITAGAQQALFLIAHGLLQAPGTIAIEQPSFTYTLSLLQSAGIRLLPIATDDDGLIPDALADTLRRHRPAMVWLNPTYHNPTGTTLPMARRQAVVELCRRFDVPIVEDGTLADLTAAGRPAPPVPLHALDPERVLYVGSLAKTVAPGLRIGWLVGPRGLIDRLAIARSQIDQGSPGPVQQLAATLLNDPKWALGREELKRALGARLSAAEESLRPWLAEGLRVRLPDGGFFLWIASPRPGSDRQRLEEALRAGVVYTPGRVYGSPDGFARLNYVSESPARLREGIGRLAPVLLK